MDLIEKIFDEILEEAHEGISYNDINIRFDILDKCGLSGFFNDVPVLIIRNKKELINKLSTYVDIVLKQKKLEKNRYNIKKCISLLFSNACYEDFSKPGDFIDNRINFYINDDFLSSEKVVNDIVIKKVSAPINKETPYAFKAYYTKDDERYYLPSIYYGISNDTCYIYNLVSTKNKDTYLEDKYDASKLVLSLFIKELYEYGIIKIKVVSCLPMRNTNSELQNLLDEFTSLDNIFKNVIISSNPFECDEYMNIRICEFDNCNCIFNDLLINKE